MSRIFDSLRQAEQEIKEASASPVAAKAGATRAAAAGTQPAEKGEEFKVLPDEEPTQDWKPEALQKQLDAGRTEVGELLAKIEQAREEWQANLENTRHTVEQTGWEEFRSAATALKADLLKEIASMSLGAAQQAQKRFEEKAAAAENEVKKSLEDFARNLSQTPGSRRPDQADESGPSELAPFDTKFQEELAAARQELRQFVAEQVAGAQKALSAHFEVAVDSMKQAAEQAAEKASADGPAANLSALSDSACEDIRSKIDAMAEPFLKGIEQALLGVEQDTSKKLQRSADNLVESSTQLVQQHTEDALEMFKEELASSSRESVNEALKELAKARTAAESLSREVREAAEKCRGEFKKTVAELQETGERQLEASFQNVLEKQRPAILHQIQKEIEKASGPARSNPNPRADQGGEESPEDVRTPAGRQASDIKEWIELARESLGSNSQKSFEAFAKQIAAVSGAALESYRQDMALMLEDLYSRLKRASRAVAADRAEPKQAPQPETARPTTGELTAQLQRAVDHLLRLAVDNSTKDKSNR